MSEVTEKEAREILEEIKKEASEYDYTVVNTVMLHILENFKDLIDNDKIDELKIKIDKALKCAKEELGQ